MSPVPVWKLPYTIYNTAKDPTRTYNTDNSGKAVNEDSYTTTATDGVMKNDRTLGEISISKVDLDAVRYVGGRQQPPTAMPRWTARCMTSTPPKILRTPMA